MKKNFPPATNRWIAIGTVAAALTICATVHGGLQIPYTANASTLHLWHLDDPDGLYAADAVATSSITLTNLGMPTAGTLPYTNVNLGVPSALGQGTCLRGATKQHLLYGGVFSDVSQFCDPVTGAFTFEALVKFEVNPLAAMDAQIVAGDNGGGITTRGWQWRVFNGLMEWNLLAGSGSDNDFKVPLPATGANAASAGTWYHAAVTYTGETPSNGDTPGLLTFYWTLLDANRVAADQLGQFTMSRPLNGAPSGTSQPGLGVGGSARNTTGNPGNGEGIIGSIDEVRISRVALRSDQMAFISGGQINPPSFTKQPPTNTLAGYGQTLTVGALASGTLPLYYQWQQSGTNLPGQTDTTLVIPHATFAAAGSYQLVVTNLYGSITSMASQVTIGAVASELANTGLDTHGVVSDGDIADPHWILLRSADATYLGPDALIFEKSFPLQFSSETGAFSPTNGISMWIGAAGNQGGAPLNSPAGQYVYRASFLVDSADPATVTMGGNLWVNGSVTDILVNGKSTGTTLAPGGTLYVTTFSITNGFVAGLNTLDFVVSMTAAGVSGLRVEIHSIGLALDPGLPVITQQPASQTVRDASGGPGSNARFSVVALGRPPLTYQWWANGAPVTSGTNRTLTFIEPAAGAPGRNLSVVVSNDSGSVTSQVAVLTIVPTNQPPVPAAFSFVAFQGQTSTIALSDIIQKSSDPDHDAISYLYADSGSTNGLAIGLANVVQTGATLVYTPVDGYVGADQFTYTISDQIDAPIGSVHIFELAAPQPTNVVIEPSGSANFSVGFITAPAGYSFQWQLNGTNLAGASTGQLNINNAQLADAGSYTLVITDPLGQTWRSPVAALTVGTLGTGTGLTGDYYGFPNGATNFTGVPTLTRLDPTVDFNFGTDAPDPSLPADYFQVRWHGQVQPLYSDTYTFYTTTDDGARLWVNGQLLVNRWQNQGATTVSGAISLQAYEKYDLVMEYYENTSAASAQLSWSSLHQAQQVIPMTQLYPRAGLVQPVLTAGLSNQTNLVVNWAGPFTLQSAPDVTGPWSAVANSTISPYTVPITAAPRMFFRLVEPIAP